MSFVAKSLSFDGISKHVDFGDVLGVDRDTVFSISIWYRKDTGVASTRFLVGKHAVGATVPLGWGFGVSSTGAVFVEMVNTWGTNYIRQDTVETFTDNVWHHLVVTRSGTDTTATGTTIFVDGVERDWTASGNNLTSTIITTGHFLVGGRYYAPDPRYFPGNICQLVVYTKVLSRPEVVGLYNGSNPINPELLESSKDSIAVHLPLGTDDTHPDALDIAVVPNVPMAAGIKSPYRRVSNEAEAQEWGRGVSLPADMSPFYAGPGGAAPFATKVAQASYYRMGPINAYTVDDAWSFSVWLKHTMSGTHFGNIMTRSQGYDNPGYALRSKYNAHGDVDLKFRYTFGQMVVETAGLSLNDGNWHHLLVTYAGTRLATGCHIWADGVDEVLNVVSAGPINDIFDDSYNLAGFSDSAGIQSYEGFMSQPAHYDGVLDGDDVAALYNGGTPQDLSLLSSYVAVPVGYWRMGEGASFPTIPDLSAGGNDCTLTNMVSGDLQGDTPGGISSVSTDFAGTNRYGTMGNVAALDFEKTDSWSVSCWVKTTYALGYFVSKMAGTGDGKGWGFGGENPGLYLSSNNFVNQLAVKCTTASISDGAWHHVVSTYDGSETVAGIKFYIDGVEITSKTTVYNNLSTYLLSNTASVNVAARSDGDAVWEGTLDEVGVFDFELTQTDVTDLYNGGAPKHLMTNSYGDIASFWDMGNPTSNEEESFDGTLVNMDSTDVSLDGPGGVLGASLLFVYSSTKHVTIGDKFDFDHDQPFSFSCWVKTTAGGWLFGKQGSGTPQGYMFGIHPSGWGTGGRIEMSLVDTWPTAAITVQGVVNLCDGAWHHVVGTYSGNSDVSGIKFYVDDTLLTNTNINNTMTASDSIVAVGDLYLGDRVVDGPLYSFGGRMTGNAIYAKELTAGEVTAIYNTGTPVDPTGLSSASALVGYWPLGTGVYPGTMTNMSAADLQDDIPHVSSLVTEKTWTTTANYDFAYVSVIDQAQQAVMDLKNKLAATGWTVIGSGNSVIYEWSGTTAGAGYGGLSTSSFDVWAAKSDIVRGNDAAPSLHSWVTLQGPVTASGQFWITIAYWSSYDYSLRVYASNAKPTLPGDPLNYYPTPSTDEWFWLLNDENFIRQYANKDIRTYFSGCAADGSFVFYSQSLNEAYWYHSIQFHVLTTDEAEPDNLPMRAVGLRWIRTATAQNVYQDWRLYDPESGQVAAAKPIGWGGYTADELNMYTEDYLRGSVQTLPVYVGRYVAGNVAGGMSPYAMCRVPDVYIHPTGVVQGSQAPASGTPKYISAGAMWFPGDTVPVFT